MEEDKRYEQLVHAVFNFQWRIIKGKDGVIHEKYLVTYSECYSGNYEVEANSKEEAEEIVKNDIYEGRREAPNNCYSSGFFTQEVIK